MCWVEFHLSGNATYREFARLNSQMRFMQVARYCTTSVRFCVCLVLPNVAVTTSV
jgi:hypothetical protein